MMQQPGVGGYMACPWCRIVGTYSHALHKTVYLNARRYLCTNHCLRNSNYFQAAENLSAPQPVSVEDEINLREEYQNLPNDNQRKNFARQNGVKGTYALMKLEYHKFNEHVQPDGMHTVTDVVS